MSGKEQKTEMSPLIPLFLSLVLSLGGFIIGSSRRVSGNVAICTMLGAGAFSLAMFGLFLAMVLR